MYNIGIVHRAGTSSTALFFPSFVAVNMIFRQAGSGQVTSLAEELSSDLRIIVETNFQVCAYVQSELHLDMLKLFVDVSVRMPNMVKNYTQHLARRNSRSSLTRISAHLFDRLLGI